jgi:molecular chaperone GrpE
MSDKKPETNANDSGNGSSNEDTVVEIEEQESAGLRDEELAKLKSDLLYLGAEFENYKKHAIRERSELIKYGSERFVRDLLEIVDNLERALEVDVKPENLTTFREGVAMTHRELQALLVRNGVTEINPVGQPFDPSNHEALTSEETDQVPAGSIARVFKKAYKMYDRLLRPAQVVVAKAPSEKKS